MNKQPKSSQEIFFFKDYLIEKYGHPLYRVSIDLPFSCPNRNATRGGGCIFCAEDGARARHLKYNLQLEQQIADGISYIQQRYGAKAPYIAYFQSFTNTYAPVNQLRELYEQALRVADFKMVIISTRPDCLPEPVIDYLAELNERYELWIELGVQSANNQTLELIQRGHDFAAVENAVTRLAARGIKCAAHVIIGLPGETMLDYRHTAEKIAALPFAGIKIHNLLVLKKTALAKMFANPNAQPPVIPLNEYEYAKALAEFLPIIPANWPVMRLTADADNKQLIAPKWWMKKGQFLEFFKKQYRRNTQTTEFIVETADGSPTLYHPEYRQHFHSLAGAAAETENKFILPCQLAERLKAGKVKLLDIGFGLGYNAIGAAKLAIKAAMLEHRTSNEKTKAAMLEHRTSNEKTKAAMLERRTSNVEHRTSSENKETAMLEHRTSNVEHRTSNEKAETAMPERRTSNVEHRTSNENKNEKTAMLERRTSNEKTKAAIPEYQKSESLVQPNGSIHIITLEQDRNTLVAAKNIFPAASLETEIIDALLQTGIWQHQYATIELKLGDARQEIQKLNEHFDCIFMDGFSPDKNPELWSFDFIRQLTLRLKPEGIIATYSSAYPVRGAMFKAGLAVGESPAFGRRRGGTVAAFSTTKLAGTSLPAKELDIIMKSTAGVPYFDRGLCSKTKAIFKYRTQLVSKLRQRGIPKWYKKSKK